MDSESGFFCCCEIMLVCFPQGRERKKERESEREREGKQTFKMEINNIYVACASLHMN